MELVEVERRGRFEQRELDALERAASQLLDVVHELGMELVELRLDVTRRGAAASAAPRNATEAVEVAPSGVARGRSPRGPRPGGTGEEARAA